MKDSATSHGSLVDVKAMTPGCGLTQRVVPGNPEESILWHRIKPKTPGETPCLPKMPGPDGLSEEHAQMVYDWILDGAVQ